ncbi:uncharacterized protein SPPG_01748 [Spizellomyces punctatus DAOM BR117]|uniref:RRM domain-containing protein n=1 Tax=Spizellomyces punctatus (strain DAOM BR117) TaxID=645134 RepID=A0A0L0HNP0_SPIPD|nr:uncharacterized protein SPPG_01748 [Spizellomyces punctatus DAOM BR117]KND02663.1 hypothetical protein SPPG_01748 [Spizellomyces punctatus DAOM BR117]|eukprot:XP_016610702.1 hypothetical protein SPPG_01748 [Spizellomyces punctatus DAOM BR117]
MSHLPKTTIHVTNITKDKATLKKMFQDMEGFRRISFHQDYCFVCFDDLSSATDAIDTVHSQTDMLAAYAKHGVASATTPTIAVQPNPILYVSLFSYFTEVELTKIFRSYDGFDSCRFFPSHALVRFKDVECAKRALEDLNSTTNLFANYSTKGAKQGSSRSSRRGTTSSSTSTTTGIDGDGAAEHARASDAGGVTGSTHPKRTIHVTNIDKDKAHILHLFSQYEGFRRVAFYADYCFVCFADTRTASKAIEEILFKTKMKANFAKADFIPHQIPTSAIGHPNSIIRVSDYPSNTSDYDLVRIFERHDGFQDIHFYHASCLVYFKDQTSARRALESVNATTNFTAIYSKKGVNSRSRGGAVSRIARSAQASASSVSTASAKTLATSTPATALPPANTSSQSSPDSSETQEDESSSSPRNSPSPELPVAQDTDEAYDDDELIPRESESLTATLTHTPPSMFIQPDMVNDVVVAAAAEASGAEDAVHQNGEEFGIGAFTSADRSDGSNSVHGSDLDGPDLVLHEHVSHHLQQQQHDAAKPHLHFATFLHQQFQLSPQSNQAPETLSAPGLLPPFSATSTNMASHLAYAQALADKTGHSSLPSHFAQAQNMSKDSTIAIGNQLLATKSFLDDLFGRYIRLEQENRVLRQTHRHSQHLAAHMQGTQHPPHQHHPSQQSQDQQPHDTSDQFHTLHTQQQLSDAPSDPSLVPPSTTSQPHGHVHASTTASQTVPITPSSETAEAPWIELDRLRKENDIMRRENAVLREELSRRNMEYERLDAAHKSCGVLQGLLAMCE